MYSRAATLRRLSNDSAPWSGWKCTHWRNVLLDCTPLSPCQSSSPEAGPTEVSAGHCFFGAPGFGLEDRCLEQLGTPRAQALSQVPASAHNGEKPVPTAIWLLCLTQCLTPAFEASAKPATEPLGKSQVCAGESCLPRPTFNLTSPFFLPSPHPQDPMGMPPPPGRPLLVKEASLFFGLTEQLLCMLKLQPIILQLVGHVSP